MLVGPLFCGSLAALEDEAVASLVLLAGFTVLLRRLNVAANSDKRSLWPGVVLLIVEVFEPEPAEPIDTVSLVEFDEIRFGAKKSAVKDGKNKI